MGNAALADIEKFSAGQRLITLQNYNNSEIPLCNELFLYFILSNFFQDELQEKKTGTTVAGIKAAILKTLWIPMPPYNEQIRIAKAVREYIQLIDDISDNVEELSDVISLTKQKILDLAISGKLVSQDPADEPASKLLERIRAEKEKLIKRGKLKRDKKESIIYKGDDNSYYEKFSNKAEKNITEIIPFGIPDNWIWCRLDNISSIIMGTSPKGTSISTDENNVEFHQGKICFSDKYLLKGNQFTSEVTKIAPANSVLLCVRAPVGEVNITQREICIGRGLSSIIPLCEIKSEFLYYWIKAFKQSLEAKATGTTFIAITTDVVKDLLIPLPPINEQVRIVDILNKYNNTLEDFALVDNLLSHAQMAIGSSSNLAQIAQSYMYSFPTQSEFNDYVCILAVLAQVA